MRSLIHAPGCGLLLLVAALLGGCGDDQDEMAAPKTPKQAASQLETVFAEAAPEVRQTVTAASEGLRNGDYEKALVSLQVVRAGESVTMQQGLAVHQSLVALESQLLSAIAAGDPNAQRAYDLLKQIKRN